MIKKFLIRISLSLLFLLLFSLKFVDATIGEKIYEHPLESAWKTTGIRLETITTEAWMKVNERWLTVYELKELAYQIQTKLKLKQRTQLTVGEQEQFTYATFEGMRRDNTYVTITLQSNRGKDFYETQMGIYTTGSFRGNLREYLRDLENEVLKLGKDGQFSILLEGKCPGKLSTVVIKELSGKVMRKLHASIAQTAFEAGGSSTKGYTELLNGDHSAVSGVNPVNVEVNTVYDRENNVTEVILESPGNNQQ